MKNPHPAQAPFGVSLIGIFAYAGCFSPQTIFRDDSYPFIFRTSVISKNACMKQAGWRVTGTSFRDMIVEWEGLPFNRAAFI